MAEVIFTSDIHGNKAQYEKLFDYAKKNNLEIILGGDLLPKKLETNSFIKGQREFISGYLIPRCRDFNKKTKKKPYLILGNDDAKINEDLLRKEESINYISCRRKKLGRLDILGYPYVPITPFMIKDWEKYDLQFNLPFDHRYKERLKEALFYGVKSTRKGWEKYFFREVPEESVASDLEDKKYTRNSRRTIHVIHSPPYDTDIDMTLGGHKGSFAIRRFIEENQPFLTLHGHLHESVRLTGHYKDEIGKTVCIASGNHNEGEQLSAILFSTDLKEMERIIL